MALLLEWLPLITFFVVYQTTNLYVATCVMLGISTLQFLFHWFSNKPISLLQQVNIGVLSITGGLTLFYGNSHFIKLKPTLVYWILAIACITSQRFKQVNIIQHMFQETFTMPKDRWDQLNRYWIVFFISIGLLNLGIAYTVDTDSWVRFKLFGLLAIQMLFLLAQFFYLWPFIKNTMNDFKFTDDPTRWIELQLEHALNPTHLEVLDQGVQHKNHATKGGGHFLVRIASSKFQEIESLVERHRLIYAALGNTVGKEIHALQIEILN